MLGSTFLAGIFYSLRSAFGYVNPLELHGIKNKKLYRELHLYWLCASEHWIDHLNTNFQFSHGKNWEGDETMPTINCLAASQFWVSNQTRNSQLTTLKKEQKEKKIQTNGCRKQVLQRPKTIYHDFVLLYVFFSVSRSQLVVHWFHSLFEVQCRCN